MPASPKRCQPVPATNESWSSVRGCRVSCSRSGGRKDGASHRRASSLPHQSSGKRTRWRQHASERSEDCTQKGAWSVYEFSNIDQTTMKEPSKFQLAWINEGSKDGLRLVEDDATVRQRFQYQMARWALRLFKVLPNFFVQGLQSRTLTIVLQVLVQLQERFCYDTCLVSCLRSMLA